MCIAHSDETAVFDVRRVARTGVFLAVLAVCVQTALYLLFVYALDRRIRMLDLDEGALGTWASASTTFAAGFVALLVSFVDPTQRFRGRAIAVVTAFFSFDDAAIIHERLALEIADALEIAQSYARVIWPLMYFPLAIGLVVFLLQLVMPTPLARRFTVFGLVFLGAAVAPEIAGIALDRLDVEEGTWPWTLAITGEENAELTGWILITTGVTVRLFTLADARRSAL